MDYRECTSNKRKSVREELPRTNFQDFLHAHGMANLQPLQTSQPYPQPPLRAQAAAFVPSHPSSYRTMTGPATQPSFFADEMYHHRHEPPDFDDMTQHPYIQPAAQPSCFFRPSLPSSVAGVANPSSPQHIPAGEGGPQSAFPSVLGSRVDEAQYTHVSYDEIALATLEYDSSSPGSTDSQTDSPLTPGSDGSGSFTEHWFKHNEPASNTVAAAFFAKQQNVNFFASAMHLSATPAPFFVSAQPLYHHAPAAFAESYGPAQHAMASMAPSAMAMPDYSIHATATYNTIPQSLPTTADNPGVMPEQDFQTKLEESPEAEDRALSDRSSQELISLSSSTMHDLRLQRQRDDYLLEMRQQGVPYKEIKRLGQYREAESTLRGRVRVLTKEKWERVRRPDWTAKDIRLLRRGVYHFAREQQPHGELRINLRKMPWKKVSLWIRANGGTYLFASATCAKKWEEVKAE